MKQHIQLTIPSPCSEKWSSFSLTAKGGFCSSCQKEVIDFSTWSDEQLKHYFKHLPKNTCGRFRQEQLTTYVYEETDKKRWGWLSAAVMSTVLLFGSKDGVAQGQEKKMTITEQVSSAYTKGEVMSIPEVTITGTVLDENGEPMPGVNVVQVGTDNGTTSDIEGRYTLVVHDPGPSVELAFSFVGFKTACRIIPVGASKAVTNVIMAMDVSVLGGLEVTRRISPRRWWWNLKGLFE